jgi:hypothetical protein
MKSAVDARAGRGWVGSGCGSLCLYSDALDGSINLGNVVGLFSFTLLVPILVAHADEAQRLICSTGNERWIVQVPKGGKRRNT